MRKLDFQCAPALTTIQILRCLRPCSVSKAIGTAAAQSIATLGSVSVLQMRSRPKHWMREPFSPNHSAVGTMKMPSNRLTRVQFAGSLVTRFTKAVNVALYAFGA